MKEKYKYMFMRYLYKKLDLKKIEDKFILNGIKFRNLGDDEISKCFLLLNDVDDSGLNDKLKEKYNYYFSLSIEELCTPLIENELLTFLEETYMVLLFPKGEDDYIYYGPLSYNYMAPRNSIVLGFYYKEFDIEEQNFEDIHFQNDVLICDSLNYIQNVLGPKANITVSVLQYNEFCEIKGMSSRL